jgi:hypothetical protein
MRLIHIDIKEGPAFPEHNECDFCRFICRVCPNGFPADGYVCEYGDEEEIVVVYKNGSLEDREISRVEASRVDVQPWPAMRHILKKWREMCGS